MLNTELHTVVSVNEEGLESTHLSRSFAYAGSASLNKFLSTLAWYNHMLRKYCRGRLWDLTSISRVLVRVQLPLHPAHDEAPSFLHMRGEEAAVE